MKQHERQREKYEYELAERRAAVILAVMMAVVVIIGVLS